jgi:hypothetical protein
MEENTELLKIENLPINEKYCLSLDPCCEMQNKQNTVH